MYRGIENGPLLFVFPYILYSFSPDFSSKISSQLFKIETSNLVYRFTTTSCIVGMKLGLLLFVLPYICSFFFLSRFFVKDISTTGLEKLTNANRSVSSVNDRLFPVELTEIADWKSISEYMLHSNFGRALTGVIGGNFCAYTFILPLPCLLIICLSFLDLLSAERILKQNKNTSEFPRINSC